MQMCVSFVRAGTLVGGLLLLGPAHAPILSDPPVTVPLAGPAASLEPAESSPHPPSLLTARALLGIPVTTEDGAWLGQLNDVLIDPAEGRITLVIVAAGRRFGLGGRFVALPWPMLRPVANGMRVVVDLELAPPSRPNYEASEAMSPR
jgi:sporulation protein YlmC with PRC-barrel domain